MRPFARPPRPRSAHADVSRPIALMLALTIALALATACSDSPDQAAARLHAAAVVVDTHSDTTPRFEDPTWRFDERHDASDGDMDLPRIREGGLDVEFFSIYMGDTPGDGAAIKKALIRIDAVHEMVRQHAPDVVLARTVDEIRTAGALGPLDQTQRFCHSYSPSILLSRAPRLCLAEDL